MQEIIIAAGELPNLVSYCQIWYGVLRREREREGIHLTTTTVGATTAFTWLILIVPARPDIH